MNPSPKIRFNTCESVEINGKRYVITSIGAHIGEDGRMGVAVRLDDPGLTLFFLFDTKKGK